MAQQKKKKLVPVTDIILSQQDSAHVRRAREASPESYDGEVYDLKLEALRDFGKARSVQTDDSVFTDEVLPQDPARVLQENSSDSFSSPRTSLRVRPRRRIGWWAGGIILLAVAVYVFVAVLPRVTLTVTAKKIPIAVTRTVVITDSASSTQAGYIAGELLTERKTNVFSFPATGTQTGSAKARGTVIIFNAYSTASQILVANTRLKAPDGKLFRLDKRVVVPGGKKTGQVFEPGSVEADVTADQAGSAYNIDPTDHFTIPGFQGSDKYEKFYATSLQPMSGGSEGSVPIATIDDIAAAKRSAEARMKENIGSTMTLKIPDGFTFIQDTQTFKIITEKTDTRVDENKNFTVAIEAESSALTFSEADARAFVQSVARKEGNIPQEYVEKEGVISYATTTSDWKNRTIKAQISYQATFWRPLDTDDLMQMIAGKKESDVKSAILELDGIDRLTVSFWPFWVSRVPKDLGRIKITVE